MSAHRPAVPAHRLVLAELRLVAIGAHRMLLVVAPDGRVVRQFNGLATGRTGPIPIGFLPHHRLMAYDTSRRPGYWLQPAGTRWVAASGGVALLPGTGRADLMLDDAADGSAGCRAATVLAGSGPALEPVLATLERACQAINARRLRYPLLGLGPNSNAVCYTLLAAARLTAPPIPDGARVLPGWGRLLLPGSELAALASPAG